MVAIMHSTTPVILNMYLYWSKSSVCMVVHYSVQLQPGGLMGIHGGACVIEQIVESLSRAAAFLSCRADFLLLLSVWLVACLVAGSPASCKRQWLLIYMSAL
jgi:hypothetical protein